MGTKESLFNCICGCGEPIPYSPRHEFPSRKPKYKAGHAHRNKFILNRSTIEKEYRELGSGFKVAEKHGVTPIAVYNMLEAIGAEMIPKEELDDHNMSVARKWELICLENLNGSIDISGANWRSPHDIEWNGLNIDVKVSSPTYSGKSRELLVWSFKTKYKESTDAFICIGLDENGEKEKMFWIPSSVIKKQTTIRRNGNTKYEKYRTNFEALNAINHERQSSNY